MRANMIIKKEWGSKYCYRLFLSLLFAVCALGIKGQTPAEWKALKGDVNLFIANDLGRNGYYDKVNYLDLNASYTWGKNTKFTIFAEANNLLNQPLRYYQGNKDRTMQVEYYGVKVNAGFKINL